MWRGGLTSAVLLGLLWATATQGATNLITGTISANATWSGTNLIQGTVVIQTNVTVSIEPGTRMLMNTNAVLQVYGQLLANGGTNAPIYFTRGTTAARWGRIIFFNAMDSRLLNCVIEYSSCIGDHKVYYDNDCNPATRPPSRTYFQAVVAVGTHLDIEGCVFQNLPDETIPSNRATEKGDAIAIISDDPDRPGTASATIRGCQFLRIGQGVHTRFSYVLVENCYFTGHFGDNDDVDLYGESIPPPLVQSNLFTLVHDDFINPTRCSAIIAHNICVGDTASGGTDHGLVLRDTCSPIVFNNVIYNCPSGGISVQNQCDALLVNNTIVNCGIGVRFIFHSDRLVPPYCLANAGAKATIINCVIWDCPTAIAMNETDDPGSRATVMYSDIEGGQATISVAGNSSYTWATGNINTDPLFVNLAANNYRLRAGAPCIDAGTNMSTIVSNDFERVPRPLDGNGDRAAAFDIGAFEYLLDSADSNNDGIPDGWTWQYRLNPTDPNVANGNPDQDAHTTLQEWIADTNPTNALSYFRIASISAGVSNTVQFLSSSNRQYTLFHTPQLPATWSIIPGQSAIRGKGGIDSLSHTNPGLAGFHKVGVALP
jgi:hypothetical protein